jgi:hypothetical protein
MSILKKSNVNKSKRDVESYRFRKTAEFFTKRRSQKRELSIENQTIISEWFNVSNITIEKAAKTSEQRARAKRLLYTWRNCFAMKMSNIKTIDLIEHSIELKSNAKSMKERILRYTSKKRKFANEIFSQMKKADIIIRMSSDWDARTKFSSKKKESDQLRVIHNYIFLNDCTIKMQYSIHRIKEVIDILMKFKFKAFFFTNVSWEYWTVTTKKEDVYKTDFVSSHEQWTYLKMSMKLIESSHIYAQFTNLMFESLSIIKEKSSQFIIIEDHENAAMTFFVNDHFEARKNFDSLFSFLHNFYFLRVTFESIYLNSKKTTTFFEELNMIDFTERSKELRFSIKHRIKILKWFTFINRAELNEFLWLTSFLRQFISKRAKHVLIMKKTYMIQVSIKSRRVKSKSNVKKCDRDLTKLTKATKEKALIVRRQWMKKSNDAFIWEKAQQRSFEHVKKSITNNVMSTTIHELQYHLTTDASKRVTKTCLFQLHEVSSDTQMKSILKNKIKIVMFMSFKLNDVETRYSNTKRECLTIVNALAKVRWLMLENKWKIICYTNHHALNSIMTKESESYERIVIWQDRLEEYDIKMMHKLFTNVMIEIVDELSRLSISLITKYRIWDEERSLMSTNDENESIVHDVAKEMIETIMFDDWTKTTKSRELDVKLERQDWERYDINPFFKKMTVYLRHDLSSIKDVSRQKKKIIISQSKKFSVTSEKSLMMYEENDEKRSSCVTSEQVKSILEHLHDEHDHYEHVIILDRLKSETYWSIRSKDVIAWCKSCFVCQFNANKHSTTAIWHILIFELMFMIDLNFLESIRSACTVIECRYVLLRVNYFSRFVWTRLYVYCTMTESTNIMNNLITSVFEWSKALYSDNERHFIEYEFEKLLQAREMIHFTASMTHSSSMNLIERMIQLMIEEIKKRCLQRETSKAWALDVTDETIVINTRRIRVHEHRSCDIMLSFVSRTIHHDTRSVEQSVWEDEMKNLSSHEQSMLMTLREKNRFLTLKTMTQYQNKRESQQDEVRDTINERNLMLIRNKARNNQKDRKLNSRWKKLRMIMRKTSHELSAWIKSLYEVRKTTRHHVNDIRLWTKRSRDEEWSIAQLMSESRFEQERKNESQISTMIQTYDEIDSFRASLKFEVSREKMRFADFSSQRALFLWKMKRNFLKEQKSL